MVGCGIVPFPTLNYKNDEILEEMVSGDFVVESFQSFEIGFTRFLLCQQN